MTGRCTVVINHVGKYTYFCACPQGEFDSPLSLPDAICNGCTHPLSKHENVSPAPVDHTLQTAIGGEDEKRCILDELHKGWSNEFLGYSVDVLRNMLLAQQNEFPVTTYYSKTIPIIQSSGTGKSRLLDEISKELLTIPFVLRYRGSYGYPPGDTEVTEFLVGTDIFRPVGFFDTQLHARVVAFLAASLAQLAQWCDEQPPNIQVKDMAKKFHDEMAPISPLLDEKQPELRSELRSEFRISFINGLLQKARELNNVTTDNLTWEEACVQGNDTMTDHRLIGELLIQPAVNLMKALDQRPKGTGKYKELLLLVFDEASNLWVGQERKDGARYFALRRVLGMLKRTPIWSFFISTQSSTRSLIPSRELENSDRVKAGELNILEPFLALQLDVAAMQAAQDNYDAEWRKPMSKFATAEHMTMFGRPLWRTHRKSPRLLRIVALRKITCAKEYNPKDTSHVFATVASRLCLDVCMKQTEAIAFAHKAVNSHLRIVLSVDFTQKDDNQDTGFLERMETITPSEPVVAEVVAELLCETMHNTYNWTTSIVTLAENLFNRGMVEKGIKGELFARLLCILARDFHLMRAKQNAVFPYATPFSVNDFLRSLLNDQWLNKIMDYTPTKPNTRMWANSQTTPFSEAFKGGYMNFTHFTSTDIHLESSTMSDLLHNLLRQQAALQLEFRQPVWDILIPVYFGNLDEEFDPARTSAILIQVKNRIVSSKFLLETDMHHYAATLSHTKDPILYILMDLGTTEKTVDISGLPKATDPVQAPQHPKNSVPLKQYLFGIHTVGVDASIFSCLENPRLMNACKRMLEEVIQTDSRRDFLRYHDELCQRNKQFHSHDWKSKFPVLQMANLELEQDAAEQDQEDTPMDGME